MSCGRGYLLRDLFGKALRGRFTLLSPFRAGSAVFEEGSPRARRRSSAAWCSSRPRCRSLRGDALGAASSCAGARAELRQARGDQRAPHCSSARGERPCSRADPSLPRATTPGRAARKIYGGEERRCYAASPEDFGDDFACGVTAIAGASRSSGSAIRSGVARCASLLIGGGVGVSGSADQGERVFDRAAEYSAERSRPPTRRGEAGLVSSRDLRLFQRWTIPCLSAKVAPDVSSL